jgi:hypothetical protein
MASQESSLARHALILRAEWTLREREIVGQRGGAAEADDQRAAALQELAPRRHHAVLAA